MRSVILETIPKKLGDVAKKAQDLSNTVKKTVGLSLRRASKELPKTIRTASNAVGTAAEGAKTAMVSHWKWLKKEVEERRK